MSELPPPGIPENPSERAAQALTSDAVSAVLSDFRAWLTDEASGVASAPREERPVGIDLHTLLSQFLAVRQEVNLQTRAVRAQQEQNAETLRQLTSALDALRQTPSRGEESRQPNVGEVIRPLLKTLLDVYDALARAGSEMQRLREIVLPELELLATATSEPEPSPSWWARLFRSPAPDRRESERVARESAECVRPLLASLVTGYTMSLQRIERALGQHGLEAIPSIGQRFDPERMEVVEAVTDSGRPAGEVIEEVRRGYLWNGRVFRYAQVRVTKG